jgi:hypothetical protein
MLTSTADIQQSYRGNNARRLGSSNNTTKKQTSHLPCMNRGLAGIEDAIAKAINARDWDTVTKL